MQTDNRKSVNILIQGKKCYDREAEQGRGLGQGVVHIVLWERWDLSSSKEANEEVKQAAGGGAFQEEGIARAKTLGQGRA